MHTGASAYPSRDVLPIRDINPTSRFAWVTLALIVANVAVFLLWQPTLQGSQGQQQAFFFCHAEIPYEISHHTDLAGAAGAVQAIEDQYGASPSEAADVQQALRELCPRKNWLLSLFTSMFLHGGWLHLGGNMLYLWIFGNNVEDAMGHVKFVGFYLAGGIAALALQVAVAPNSTAPTVGASGAIAAVLGAYIILYPRARVLTFVFIILFFTVIELPAILMLGIWFAEQAVFGATNLTNPTGGGGGVAYFAHVGGFAFGALTIRLLASRRPQIPSRIPAY